MTRVWPVDQDMTTWSLHLDAAPSYNKPLHTLHYILLIPDMAANTRMLIFIEYQKFYRKYITKKFLQLQIVILEKLLMKIHIFGLLIYIYLIYQYCEILIFRMHWEQSLIWLRNSFNSTFNIYILFFFYPLFIHLQLFS